MAQVTSAPITSIGAQWHRWDPHVHAPGTKLNDQFGGANSWDEYLDRLEQATPALRAIGVTDYYSLDCYERLTAAKSDGRLQNCALLFPNIEMRLGVGTVRNAFVNIHLLVSPESDDHVSQIRRFLARLSLRAHGETFSCTPDELADLGRRSNSAISDQAAALAEGSRQFKVSFDQLRDVYSNSDWAQANVLIAVAGGSTDGVSGVRDAADRTLRQEIEAFAHIIFASTPSQRDFWLGNKTSPADVIDRFGALKPCLHGSDAHSLEKVAAPDLQRYSWIKGSPHFDALRQAQIEPAGRTWIGDTPPAHAGSSQVLSEVALIDAPWAETPRIPLNPGLVAIIGARGSGKTALADAIAHGCDASDDPPNTMSFLARAHDLLDGNNVRLTWADGTTDTRPLDGSYDPAASDYPKARYLSQQFVDALCSADGMTDALLAEVERVVFDAHNPNTRDGAVDFQELLEARVSRHRLSREREEDALVTLSDLIGNEIEKTKAVTSVAKQVGDKRLAVTRYTADRGRLVSKGSEARAERLAEVATAAEKVAGNVRWFVNREAALLKLRDEVIDLRTNRAPATLRVTKERHQAARIKDPEWGPFLLNYEGDVDAFIEAQVADAKSGAAGWRGRPVSPPADPTTALVKAVCGRA